MNRQQQADAVVREFAPRDGSGALGRRCRDELNALYAKWDAEDLNARVPELNRLADQRNQMWRFLVSRR